LAKSARAKAARVVKATLPRAVPARVGRLFVIKPRQHIFDIVKRGFRRLAIRIQNVFGEFRVDFAHVISAHDRGAGRKQLGLPFHAFCHSPPASTQAFIIKASCFASSILYSRVSIAITATAVIAVIAQIRCLSRFTVYLDLRSSPRQSGFFPDRLEYLGPNLRIFDAELIVTESPAT
jgi:hypothetical protein